MNKALQLYRFLNILSLDIVAGAIICTLFFADVFHVDIKASGIIALALSVWIIYTTDHLLDASRIKNNTASTERHRFHQRHFKILFIAVLCCIAVNLVEIFFIRKPILLGGIGLTAIIVLYFFLQLRLKFLKEFFAAILYTGGVLLAPGSLLMGTISSGQIILCFQFLITALINLILFSWLEREQDDQDKRESFTTVFGETISKRFLISLFVLNITSIVFMLMYYQHNNATALTLRLMNLLLLMITVFRKYYKVNDRYRLLGDAVFMVPLLYLLLPWR